VSHIELAVAGIGIVGSCDMGEHGRTVTVIDPAANYLQPFQHQAVT